MKNFKIGEPIKSSLSNSILIGVYGNDAILYSNSNNYEQYVYAHNIEYYEKANKCVWSRGDYYDSLEECMIQVIANKKEVFYDLLDTTQKLHYSTYIKGIVKTEKEIEEENILDCIYEEYMERDYMVGIFSDDLQEIIDKEIIKQKILLEKAPKEPENKSLLEKAPTTNNSKEHER